MIGSLLSFVLFPLSRYLSRRPPVSNKGLPPAVRDGQYTRCQTTRLDPRLGPSRATGGGAEGETKERMEEPSPGKLGNEGLNVDEEQPMPALVEGTSTEAAMGESAATERGHQPDDSVEAARKEDGEVTTQRSDADGDVSPAVNQSSEPAPTARLECLHTEVGAREDTGLQQQHTQSTEPAPTARLECLHTEVGAQQQHTQSSEPAPTARLECLHTEVGAREDTGLQQQHTQSSEPAPTARLECLHTEVGAREDTGLQQQHTQSSEPAPTARLECLHTEVGAQQQQHTQSSEPAPPPVTATPVTECWDAYEVQTEDDAVGPSGSELPHPSPSFEAGGRDAGFPGLAEDTRRSPWWLPAGSYYPPVEQVLPFEVTWRVWEDLDSSATAAQGECTMNFTVMSYNILAQDLLEANEDLYRHSASKVLDWSFRCTLLIKEIQKWAPDILCLQEVQENHYSEHLYPALSQMGYTCVYKRRTGTKTDGCATCYRSRCFSAVSLARLEFFKPETELLDRHNVGIVVLLQPAAPRGSAVAVKGPVLCVANTHLLFNPRRGDVKLAQLAMMLAEIDRTVKSCEVKGQRCDVILCGDFNAVPHMPLYKLITSGQLCYHGLPAWMISGQEDLSYKAHSHRLFAPLWPSSLQISDNCQYVSVNDMFDSRNQESGKRQYSHDFMLQLRYCPAACVRPQDLTLIPGVTDNTPDPSRGNQPCDRSHVISHRLDLESVYQHILPGSGSSEVTTLNSDAGATVDYIFYSPQRVVSSEPRGGDFASGGLKLTGRLSLLSEDVLWGMNGLPNDTFPSDHLSLLAQFQLDLNTV